MTKKTILVVDDSAFMRLSIMGNFPEGAYNFIEASNGEEALKFFKDKQPDLVLLDLVMPKMRGVEALENIKKLDKNAKVVVITAVGRKIVTDECTRLGAAGVIKKPFDPDTVLELVQGLLK